MLRTLTIAALTLGLIAPAVASTGVYKCSVKKEFKVGNEGLLKAEYEHLIPQLILFDVRSGLLTRKYKNGKAIRDQFTVINRPRTVKSALFGDPIRSDVTAYKVIIHPRPSNFSSVMWTFSILFRGPGGDGRFLLVVRQSITTGTCKEL